jgi:hypothetical protein
VRSPLESRCWAAHLEPGWCLPKGPGKGERLCELAVAFRADTIVAVKNNRDFRLAGMSFYIIRRPSRIAMIPKLTLEITQHLRALLRLYSTSLAWHIRLPPCSDIKS